MFGRDRLLKRVVRERFAVTPKTGPMFNALLVAVDARSMHFADVRVHSEDGVERKAQGELYIERANVAYVQRVVQTVKEQ